MRSRWSLGFGWAAIAGGILTVLVQVPASWYGAEPRDSYLFHPPTLSPLWISRELVPILSALAVLGLLLGIVGIVRRDRPVSGRPRRWGGIGASIGFALLTLAVPMFQYSTGDSGEERIFLTLGAFGLGLLGLVFVVPSLASLAYGYTQTGRPRLGYAFAAVLVGVPVLSFLIPGPLDALAAALPIGIAWVVIGSDLTSHSGPLSVRESQTEASEGPEIE